LSSEEELILLQVNKTTQDRDVLADNGRKNDTPFRPDDEEWIGDHPALHDGAGLQALDDTHIE
jgi:hypothetical protein